MAGSLRVLWVMEHAGFVRYFESALRELVRRNHHVTVAFETGRDKLSERRAAGTALQGVNNLQIVDLADAPPSRMEAIAYACRSIRDSLRYHPREYRQAPLLRDRADRFLPPLVGPVVRAVRRLPVVRGIVDRGCALVERSVQARPAVREFVAATRPDVVVVTPGINFEGNQPEYLKAAAAAGVPTVAAIPSWDNLTTKGRLNWIPDRVLVWNDAMRGEARRYHDVPDTRVRAVGATVFDPWFEWGPSRPGDEFRRAVGLPVDRPFVLYLGSSSFLAPREVEFVESWIRAIRASSDPRVASLAILVRPHPTNVQPWNSADVEGYGGVAVWPRRAQHPSEIQVRRDFYDSLYYASAVVGANTSAQIEAAIVGRPVLSVQSADLERSQQQVLHFSHLAGGSTPLLVVARNFDEHVGQLRDVLEDADRFRPQLQRFVDSFVRPSGPVASAARVTDEVEQLAAEPRPAAARPPLVAPLVRAAAYGPGTILVWLAGVSGKPAWAIALRAVFRTAIVVGTPLWAGAEAMDAWPARIASGSARLRRKVARRGRDLRGVTVKAYKRTAKRLNP